MNDIKGTFLVTIDDEKIIATNSVGETGTFNFEKGKNTDLGVALETSLRRMKNRRYNVQTGDAVQIIDNRLSYLGYYEWVATNVESKEEIARYNGNTVPNNGDIGVIISVAPHLSNENAILAYVKIKGLNYVMKINGLKKCKEN